MSEREEETMDIKFPENPNLYQQFFHESGWWMYYPLQGWIKIAKEPGK